MSMFDYFVCSKDIGDLTNVECQTKDMDRYYGGTMSFYWVDPSGMMWTADFSGTSDFVFDEDAPSLLGKVKCIPNGRKGKVSRVTITDYVTVYTSKTQPDGMVEWIECKIHFIDGILQSYTYINKYIKN